MVPVAVEDDIEAAREAVRPFVAFYLGGMGAKGKNFYVDLCDDYGYGEDAREIQDRFLAGDRMGAIRAVTPDVIDAGGIACTPDELPGRVAAYERAGATSLLAIVFGSDRAGTVARLANLGG